MAKKEIGIPPKTADVEFSEAISKLRGKILGHDEQLGIYEITSLWKGGSDEPSICVGQGRMKHELERNGIENYMRFSLVSRHLRWLMGEILTIAEASIDNETRLKATKDLIRDKFSSKLDWMYELCGMPEDEQNSLLNPVK